MKRDQLGRYRPLHELVVGWLVDSYCRGERPAELRRTLTSASKRRRPSKRKAAV